MVENPEPTNPEAPRPPGTHPEPPDQATLHQDTYRKVLFGQASDPLFPPHPAPPETPEEELDRQALSDPQIEESKSSGPTLWRVLTLVLVAVIALIVVFWWFR